MALTPQINRVTSNEAFFSLLTITPADESETLYAVNNNEDVLSRGITFTAYPFAITLPSDLNDGLPIVQLVIDNVDQRFIEIIRGLFEPPIVKLEIVLSATPDIVEKEIDYMRLADVSYTQYQITGTLEPINILMQPAVDAVYGGTEWPDLVWT